MSKPCSVCARDDRAAIDVRLAQQVVNVRALAAELGLGREALRNHRAKHLPTFLVAFSASAKAPALGSLMAEYQRHYLTALDHLAQAQAGVISHVDKDGIAHKLVSNTAILGALAEVRRALDRVTALAADAASEDERPKGVSTDLDRRLSEAVERVLNKAKQPALDAADAITDAVVVEEHDLDDGARAHAATSDARAGGLVVVAPVPATIEIPLDAAIAPEKLPGVLPNVRRVLEAARAADGTATPEPAEMTPILHVPNPNYPGDIPSSSSEERKAMGYPDIPVTLDDLKAAAPTILAEVLEARRLREAPPADEPQPVAHEDA